MKPRALLSYRLAGAGVLVTMTIAMVGNIDAMDHVGTTAAAAVGADQADPVRALDFQQVDYFSGAITGVAVEGHMAYISRGVHVEALDVTDPLTPRVVGRSAPLPGLARVAAATGGEVYLVEIVRNPDRTGVDRLHIVDAADPTALELRGSLDLPKDGLTDFAVRDGWLYAAGSKNGLIVVDVHDPAHPVQVGTVATEQPASAVAVADSVLLVGTSVHASDGGLRVYDLADPAAPRFVSAVDVGQEVDAIAPLGRYALAATWENVFVIDTTDPTRPRVVSQLKAYGGSAFAVARGRAFLMRAPIAVRERPYVALLDVSALPNLRNLGELPLWTAYGIAAVGDVVLAADGPWGLRIAGPGSGDEPALVQRHLEPTIGDSGGIVVDGTYAYVTDGDGELWVLDVAGRAKPPVVGRVELTMPPPYGGPSQPGTAGLAVRDGYAYVARTGYWTTKGGLNVVDVSTPAAPRQVAAWDADSETLAPQSSVDPNGYPPALAGDRLFVTGSPLFAELDIADPAAPRLGRQVELRYPPTWLPGWPKPGDVALAGERAWVAEPIVGLHLLDLSDPAGIREVAHLDTPGEPSDVAVRGAHVLLADGPKGLRVIDATTLQPVRSIEDRSAVRLHVVGATAFIAGYLPDANYEMWPFATGVWAVDVTDAAAPVVRGEYVEPFSDDDPPADMAVAGDALYVTAASAGIDIVRLSEGDMLPPPSPGPTLTPLATQDWRTPTATEEPIEPLPSSTSAPTMTAEIPATARTPGGRLYLPSVLSPLFHHSVACPSAGGISASAAEEHARRHARFEACDEPKMRSLDCITVREADELYDAGLQGWGFGGVPLDADLCIWWSVFEGRVPYPSRPPVRPAATPTSTVMPTATTAPTEDPCPPAVLMIGFEKPDDWMALDISWSTGGERTSTPEATATPHLGSPTETPQSWPTPTVCPAPTVTPTPVS